MRLDHLLSKELSAPVGARRVQYQLPWCFPGAACLWGGGGWGGGEGVVGVCRWWPRSWPFVLRGVVLMGGTLTSLVSVFWSLCGGWGVGVGFYRCTVGF